MVTRSGHLSGLPLQPMLAATITRRSLPGFTVSLNNALPGHERCNGGERVQEEGAG